VSLIDRVKERKQDLIRRHARADDVKGLTQVLITLASLALLWWAALSSAHVSYWLTVGAVLLAVVLDKTAQVVPSYLRDHLVRRQELIASITSENGTFGDTRSSICAVEVAGDRIALDKDATTVSYGEHADAQLVTCRRAPDAAASDQVLVLFRRGDYSLAPTGTWDTLGMRGTCSPGAKFAGRGGVEQIVPGSFADSSAQTMVPYSHILWSALWCGIAADAVARAAQFVRAEARKKPGVVPPQATRLARAHVELQAMRHNWEGCAREFDELGDDRGPLDGMGWALKLNQLKMGCSELAPRIVHEALQIIGILAYKNDSKFSVGRHYRDVLSASLMVSNERISGKSASMLLVFKDD